MKSILRNCANMFRSGLVAPSLVTSESICLVLDEEDEQQKDELTKRWRDHKLAELNFVGIVGALLATCLTSTGSWPTILPNGQPTPWFVRACWYCGIVFALFAVLTAAQQSLRLHRLSGHRDGLEYIRRAMAQNMDSYGRRRPHWMQIYAWQISVLFLTLSVVCMLLGMGLLAWKATSYGPSKERSAGWWDENSKLAVTFTVVLVSVLVTFIITQASLSVDDESRH